MTNDDCKQQITRQCDRHEDNIKLMKGPRGEVLEHHPAVDIAHHKQ